MNSHVLYNPKMEEIHRLDFTQQLPLELILPEVWTHVFCKQFGCWFGESLGPDAPEEVFTGEKTCFWTFRNRKVKRFSARSLIVESKFLQISLTYARNRNGPNALPCGTAGVTLTSSDNYIPVHNQTFTHCKFSFRLQHVQWLYMNINIIHRLFPLSNAEHNTLRFGSCFHGRSSFLPKRSVLCQVDVRQRRKVLWKLMTSFRC